MLFAQIVVSFALVYLIIGVGFSAYFVLRRISDFDESAKGARAGFKLIIFLGTIPFWIFIAARLFRGTQRPNEKNAHRKAAGKEL